MIEGLNLQAAGIGVDAHGAIIVNDQLRTTVPHIWAMGDVKGGSQFTYVSLDDFRIIRDQLFGDKNVISETVILCNMQCLLIRHWHISESVKKKL